MQQMHDKATRGPGRREAVVEQALVVSGKPDAAVVRAQKLRQQAEYRYVVYVSLLVVDVQSVTRAHSQADPLSSPCPGQLGAPDLVLR